MVSAIDSRYLRPPIKHPAPVRSIQILCVLSTGHPATNDCLGALLATTLGFWYFMFHPSEALASFVASPCCRHPPTSNGKMGSCLSSRLSLVPSRGAVNAATIGRRATPNALASRSMAMFALWVVDATAVSRRTAKLAMVFVVPVFVLSRGAENAAAIGR